MGVVIRASGSFSGHAHSGSGRPRTVWLTSVGVASKLSSGLNSAHRRDPKRLSCPNDTGAYAKVLFYYRKNGAVSLHVGTSGCRLAYRLSEPGRLYVIPQGVISDVQQARNRGR